MTKSETLNLRVSSEFKRSLAEEAAKEKRSVTNYVRFFESVDWGWPRKLTDPQLDEELASNPVSGLKFPFLGRCSDPAEARQLP